MALTCPPVALLSEYRAAWLLSDVVGRRDAGGLCDPWFPGIRRTSGLPPQVGVHGYLLLTVPSIGLQTVAKGLPIP
jgi:hypothetical protein